MRISYNKLWKILIDKEMNKKDLKDFKEVFMTLKPLFADSKRRVDEGEMPFRFGEMPFHL